MDSVVDHVIHNLVEFFVFFLWVQWQGGWVFFRFDRNFSQIGTELEGGNGSPVIAHHQDFVVWIELDLGEARFFLGTYALVAQGFVLVHVQVVEIGPRVVAFRHAANDGGGVRCPIQIVDRSAEIEVEQRNLGPILRPDFERPILATGGVDVGMEFVPLDGANGPVVRFHHAQILGGVSGGAFEELPFLRATEVNLFVHWVEIDRNAGRNAAFARQFQKSGANEFILHQRPHFHLAVSRN